MPPFIIEKSPPSHTSVIRTIRFSSELFERLELACARYGVSFNRLVNQCAAYALSQLPPAASSGQEQDGDSR